jgi:N-acetylglutamate synthase-like GNAT family acetyltransferase
MNEATHRLRRATLDDLEALKALWSEAGLPVLELEKRFTEFQVIESASGKLIGALGLQIQAAYGKLHSEALAYPDPDSVLRSMLWERVQNVARNHGLHRVWTLEGSSFWPQQGFQSAPPSVLERLPATFGDRKLPWLALQLREENALASMEKDFELFKVTQQEETEKVLRQARVFKLLATVVAIIFFVIVVMGIFFLFKQNQLPRRR